MGASISYELNTGQYNQKNISSTGTVESEVKGSGWQTTFKGFYGFGFFPNTRTQVQANLVADVLYFDNKTSQLASELNFIVNYFIGYRTYLTATTNITYKNFNLRSGTSSYYGNFSVSLSHILF